MKKFVPVFVAFALAFSLVLAGFSPAQAAVKWDDPVVTPLSGDTEFTVTLLDPAKIGSYKGESGLTIPDGFLDAEKQFGGKLLVLKGVSLGSEKLCFPFPTYQYGWRGFLARWDGTKWVKLTTTVTTGKEGAAAMACTTIYGDGTYGLIVSYNPDNLANSTNMGCPSDAFEYTTINYDWVNGILTFYIMYNGKKPLGTDVSWNFQSFSPPGAFTSGLTGTLPLNNTQGYPGIQFPVGFNTDNKPYGFSSFYLNVTAGNECSLIWISW
jgi:hypothetical protein